MSRVLVTRIRDEVVSTAAAAFDVRAQDIMGGDRSRQNAYARHYAMWLLRELGYSFPEIGRQLGNDHTSVIYGVRGHQTRADAGVYGLRHMKKSEDRLERIGNIRFEAEPNQGSIAA